MYDVFLCDDIFFFWMHRKKAKAFSTVLCMHLKRIKLLVNNSAQRSAKVEDFALLLCRLRTSSLYKKCIITSKHFFFKFYYYIINSSNHIFKFIENRHQSFLHSNKINNNPRHNMREQSFKISSPNKQFNPAHSLHSKYLYERFINLFGSRSSPRSCFEI